MLEIPLVPEADYEFLVDVEDQTLQLRVRWNVTEGAWYMDIDAQTFDLELTGLKLAGGVSLLKPHAVLELGGLFVLDAEGKGEDPDFDLLGDRYKLMYVEKDEINDFTI